MLTPTFWVGILVIVIFLELIRIAMTTWVLKHILESAALRRPGEEAHAAGRGFRTAAARGRREVLLDPTLRSLRGAMAEVSAGRAGPASERAIEALDRYAAALVEERAVR